MIYKTDVDVSTLDRHGLGLLVKKAKQDGAQLDTGGAVIVEVPAKQLVHLRQSLFGDRSVGASSFKLGGPVVEVSPEDKKFGGMVISTDHGLLRVIPV